MRAPKRYFREMTERQPRDERERENVKFSGNLEVLNGKSPLDGWRAEFCSPYGDLLMVLSRLSYGDRAFLHCACLFGKQVCFIH